MSLQLIALIIVILANLALGSVALLRNKQGKTNRLFAFLVIVISVWMIGSFFEDTAQSIGTAKLFLLIDLVTAPIMAYTMFLLISSFFGSHVLSRPIRIAIALTTVIAAILPFTPLLAVNDITLTGNGINYQDTDWSILYYFFVILPLIASIVTVFRHGKEIEGTTRQQVRLIIFGLTLWASVALIGNLLIPAIFGPTLFSRIGIYGSVLYISFTTYAIVRLRLFDIRAFVARSAAYIFSIGSFAFIYGFLVYGLSQGVLLKNILTTERSQQIFNIVLAVILAFTFPVIRRFFERITDRIFYRDRYDPQILVSNIGRVLASEIQLDPLTKKVVKILEDDMRLTDANIVVLGEKNHDGGDESGPKGKLEIFYQTHMSRLHQTYHIDDISTLRLPVVITDELAPSDEREMLERYNIRAALSLKTHEAFVGYLFLGDKRSGDIYNDLDIQTLRIISNELAVAIQNARSYTEIQAFNETLKVKIEQATKDLTHANHELKALDKAKDEFISMASHQLRTPLTAVRGYTSMVMDGDFGKVSAEQKESLRQSFDAATRMSRLVDDLLNVSRIQSGKFKIERTAFDLNKALPEEMSLLNTTASTKNVTVTYHAPKTPVPLIAVDEGKTRQCIMNLADNAIYYSSTVKTGGKVDVYLESDGKDIIYRVVDNGIGVPKDQQAKLFKKFYRAPNAQKTRPDGTGLGLFLVGKVIAEQGGEIIFESEEGKGSTFGWKLPLGGENDASKVPAEAPSGNAEPELEPPMPAKDKKPTS